MVYQRGFIVPLLLAIIAILLAGGAYVYKQSGQMKINTSTRDITAADLAQFFNSRLDCSGANSADLSSPICFTPEFHSTNAMALYDDPIYQLVDFTGDGKLDALVTIYISGSGSMRDFYAVTTDPHIASPSQPTVVYISEGAGFARGASTPYFVSGGVTITCPASSPDSYFSCVKNLQWDASAKTFIVLKIFYATSQNQQTTSTVQTADWKTYRSDKYGFSLQYPPGWGLQEYEHDDNIANLTSNDNKKLKVGIYVYPNYASSSPSCGFLIHQISCEERINNNSVRVVREVTAGQSTAQTYKEEEITVLFNSGTENIMLVGLIKDGNGVQVPGAVDTLNSIIDSVKLILKTYRNDKYGFEVMYPGSYSPFFTAVDDSNITFRSSTGCPSLNSGGGKWPVDCQEYDILVQQNKITAQGYQTSKILVAGIEAEKLTMNSGVWDNMAQVVVQFQNPKDYSWYIQTFTFNKDQSQKAESVINLILSTFKFNP